MTPFFGSGSHDAPVEEQTSPQVDELDLMVTRAVNAAIAREDQEAFEQAGGTSAGPPAPALEIGPQRYRDPSIWRPDDIETALTEDKCYRAVYEIVEQIDGIES